MVSLLLRERHLWTASLHRKARHLRMANLYQKVPHLRTANLHQKVRHLRMVKVLVRALLVVEMARCNLMLTAIRYNADCDKTENLEKKGLAGRALYCPVGRCPAVKWVPVVYPVERCPAVK